MLVIDASYILSFLLDEKSPDEKEKLLALIANNILIAPELLKVEVTNSLTMKLKRNLFDIDYCHNALLIFNKLEIDYFETTLIGSLDAILNFAYDQKLTAYDALYLKLALKYAAEIASFDKKIISAAHKIGVGCYC